MSVKLFGIGAPLLACGLYAGGVFDRGYSREVERPPAAVMTALQSLDIADAPGAPGTDPQRSGGVPSITRLETVPGEMRWKVMSGDKVATTMIADFAPAKDGQATRITAHVERGDAPDDYVAPAFRSNRLTLALFSMVLERRLDDLTGPAVAASAETCDALRERFQDANIAAGADRTPRDLSHAIGNVAGIGMRLSAFEQEAHRLGCDKDDGQFHPVVSRMEPSADRPGAPGQPRTTFTPGQPMIDTTPPGERRGW